MRVLALAAVLVLAGPGMLGQVVGSNGGVGVLGVGVNRYSIEARLMAGAVKGQPYSLVEKTTLVRVLGDGTTITTVQETRRARDSEGRERAESGTVVDGKLQISFVTLLDPVAMTSTTLFERSKTARVTHVPGSEIEAQEGKRVREPRPCGWRAQQRIMLPVPLRRRSGKILLWSVCHRGISQAFMPKG